MKPITTSRVFLISLALAFWALCAAQPVVADDGRQKLSNLDEFDLELDDTGLFLTTRLSFVSSYYYRGLQLYDNTSLQPSIGFFYSLGKYGTIGASVWSHIPLADSEGDITFLAQSAAGGALVDQNGNPVFQTVETDPKFIEVDPSLTYDYTWEWLTVSLGHIWYTNPKANKNSTVFTDGMGNEIVVTDTNGNVIDNSPEIAPDTSEFYVGLSFDVPGNPTVTWYHDYREINYNYYSLTLSENFEMEQMGEGWNISPYVNFGFSSNGEFVYNDEGLVHITAGLTSALPWGDFIIKPIFVYNFGLDDENGRLGKRTTDQFIFGVDIVYDVDLS